MLEVGCLMFEVGNRFRFLQLILYRNSLSLLRRIYLLLLRGNQ